MKAHTETARDRAEQKGDTRNLPDAELNNTLVIWTHNELRGRVGKLSENGNRGHKNGNIKDNSNEKRTEK